jgi:glycosyltransferase involved in cell wall biosynthesis/ubiquinone/menaquinone biosynthesis C-methylase UbiE
MRIGYVLTNFSPLSESFIRREVLALCDEGHRVFVYTHYRHTESEAPRPAHRNLVVKEIPFLNNPALLQQAAFDDGIEHLHGSLMSAAQRATLNAARALQTPFTLMVYSGLDVFARRDPDLYATAAVDPFCVSVIVEDAFMRDWMMQRFGVPANKISIIPNSFDLELYRLPEPRPQREQVVILAIARFVEKKGLIYLVQAFNQLCAARANAELHLIGYGPEEQRLRQAAAGNPRVTFLGAASEAETRAAYAAADIFCLPCIHAASGDADGVPTTVLEAMAFELPVVTTNLLSTPCYVSDGQEGFLLPPGNPSSIAWALEQLSADAKLRERMGKAGRARVSEICDAKRNVKRLEQIFNEGRLANWREKLRELERQRHSYTAEREAYYTDCRVRAINYFKPSPGKLLDIGCSLGKLRLHLPESVEYFGSDTMAHAEVQGAFPFAAATAESLPFKDNAFDAAVFYAVLIHVIDVDRALAEAARILKPGGRLYLQECYDDPNPIHMNHFSGATLRQRVSEYFNVLSSHPANEYLMMMIAEKPFGKSREHATQTICDAPVSGVVEKDLPLASICITTYNRAELIQECVESVLRQTYPNLEIVVVDDGSSDDTRRVLEGYGSAIRVVYNERNQGIAFSKNRALTTSSRDARYVGVLDSDDYYHPSFVERCVEFLEHDAEVGLVYTDDVLVDPVGREMSRQRAVEPWDTDNWLRTRNLRGDTWLARRELVMQTELHDPATSPDEDYDLFYQLLEITKFGHLQEYLVYIRQHEGRTTTANRLALARAHAANLVKHGYSPEYAYLRARYNPEWVPAIEEGIDIGRQLCAARRTALAN